MNDLAREERETHLNLVADNRGKWYAYSDDPVMINKLDKIATAVKVTSIGKYYELEKGQVILRRKVIMSDEQRAQASERAKKNFGQLGTSE